MCQGVRTRGCGHRWIGAKTSYQLPGTPYRFVGCEKFHKGQSVFPCAPPYGQRHISGSVRKPPRGDTLSSTFQPGISPLGVGATTSYPSQCRTCPGSTQHVHGLGIPALPRCEQLALLWRFCVTQDGICADASKLILGAWRPGTSAI